MTETCDPCCRDCEHSQNYHDHGPIVCFALRISHPCKYMRHESSACGVEGKLFKPRAAGANHEGDGHACSAQ